MQMYNCLINLQTFDKKNLCTLITVDNLNAHGEILRKILKSKDITQEEFAEMVGVSRVTIVNLIRKEVFTHDWIDKISTALSISKSEFTGKESTQYSINTDPSHILTANERQALWDIIQAQKDVIDNLRRQLSKPYFYYT